MTDAKITAWYTANPVTLDPGDLIPVTENTGTTPAGGAAKLSQLMFNRYKITPTVSSNNLTVALKHEDGNDPSADRPLYFKIGDTLRAVTAALSVTKNAGTNYFNSGAAELATLEQDYFVYLGYNATDGVTIGFARIPYGRLYSDFSATSTNEKYCAISNIAHAAAGDDYTVIGRFGATLSATASFNWSVPTYTTANLIQFPIFETRNLTWTPVWTNLNNSTATVTAIYNISGRILRRHLEIVFGASTAISGSVSYSVPFAFTGYGAVTANNIVRLFDTSPGTSYAGLSYLNTGNGLILLVAQSIATTYVQVASLSSTIPFTWATGDSISDSGQYFIVA